MNQISIEEFIELVQSDITIFGALPRNLPDQSIRQYVETIALEWFYQNYKTATTTMYYHVHKDFFRTPEYAKHKYIQLPNEVQFVTWAKRIDDANYFQLGINVPSLSINLGVSNSPFLSSFATTIGELGVYKTIIDSLSDMLDQMNLYTVKSYYNHPTRRLEILSDYHYHIMLEVEVRIPVEYLYTNSYFLQYVTAWSKMQLGRLLGTFNYVLPGGVKYNASDLKQEGKEEMDAVKEYITKTINNNSLFVMTKR